MDNVTAVCPLHGVQMEEKTGQYGSFWSHRTPEGFCDGKKIKPFKNPTGAYYSPVATSPATREPIKDDSEKAKQAQAVWDAKDRQSLAQTAMKSSSEIIAALINAKALTAVGSDITPVMDLVKSTANQLYLELKAMKKDEWDS